MLPNGEIISDPMAMGMIAISYFQNILSPQALHATVCLRRWFQELLAYRCPQHFKESMAAAPDAAEITKVMMKLNANKSPGPDGLTSGFFKASWALLGSEVVTSIGAFFTSGFLPSATNAMILCLVPKRPGASAISDYRPISSCNTLYKVISKLLVHRLKPILPSFIFPNQTAFVQGRLLVENTVFASEIIHRYHRNKGPKRMVIKVDIYNGY